MVTFPLSPPRATIKLPTTREELRDMLQDRAVAMTVVICTTIAILGAFASVVYLAATGNDTAVIGILVGGPVLGLLGLVLKRLGAVQEGVRNSQQGGPE